MINEAEYLRHAYTTPQEEQERRRASQLIFGTFYIARQFAKTVAATDVAVAARQHMLLAADSTDDPVTIAASRWSLGLQLITEGYLDLSEEIIGHEIEGLRTSTVDDDLTRQSLLGMLNAAASIVAIR